MSKDNNINVDRTELDKFAKIAENWWDLNGPMKPLHQMNASRLMYVQQHSQIADKLVLDIGCGGGILTESLAKNQANVMGIDMDEHVLQAAKQHCHASNLAIDYQQISAETLAIQKPNYFDVVTCMELLEHVPNPGSVINACAALVKPGGRIFFSTINRNLKAFFGAIIGAEYILNLLPRGTHQYKSLIRPSELVSWAKQAGLTLINLQGVSYNPFQGIATLSKDTSINYLVCFERRV